MKDNRLVMNIVFIIISAIIIVYNPLSNEYVNRLKKVDVATSVNNNALYKKIVMHADKSYVAPIDATIDRVWKATPGYNGLKIDINASYQKMKKNNTFDKKKLMIKQISPKIHLTDLPPSPIYRGNSDKPMVSFLINVASGNEYIPDILTVLKLTDVNATFFLEGRWVQENPNIAKMIADGGHELGNHSYSHPNMKTLNNRGIHEELIKTNEVIQAITTKEIRWFAPPSGSFSQEVVEVASEHQMNTVIWTVDTTDWQNPAPDLLIRRVLSKLEPGSMILMHPTASTAQALEQPIKEIKDRNLRIGSVSKLLDEERIIVK